MTLFYIGRLKLNEKIVRQWPNSASWWVWQLKFSKYSLKHVEAMHTKFIIIV